MSDKLNKKINQPKSTDVIAIEPKNIADNLVMAAKKVLVEVMQIVNINDSSNVFILDQAHTCQNRLFIVKILKSGDNCEIPPKAAYGLIQCRCGNSLPFTTTIKIVDFSDIEGFMTKI